MPNETWSQMLEGQDPATMQETRLAMVAPNTQLGVMLGVSGGHQHHGGVIPSTANGKKGGHALE